MRKPGDIADIQTMASPDGALNELEGVENVFEKNLHSFDKLMETSQSAGSMLERRGVRPQAVAP